MKFALIIIFYIIAVFYVVKCGAESEKQNGLSSVVEEMLSSLDISEISDVYSKTEMFADIDPAQAIRDYVSGRVGFSASDIVSAFLQAVFGGVTSCLPEVLSVLAVAVFGAVLDAIKPNSDFGLSALGSFIVNSVVIALISTLFYGVFKSAENCVGSLSKQIQAVFPVILTLIAASGATATSAAFQPSVAYVATFESVVAAKVLFPIVTLLFLFGAVTALSGFMNAGRMNDFFKSAFKWIAGATSVVFTFFMTATGIVASTYDGFSIKALKYVASGSVPIAGQFVGGGIEAVFAACVLIKNAIGALSLAAILLTVILPIIKIAVLSLLLRFLAATAEPIANGKTIKFISSSADALNYLAGIIISVAVVYFITLLIAVSALGGAA